MGDHFTAIRLINSLLNGCQKMKLFCHILERTVGGEAGERIKDEFLLAHGTKLIQGIGLFNLFRFRISIKA